MRKPLLSLEDIEIDASLHSVDPITMAMVDEPGTIVIMDDLDSRGDAAAIATNAAAEVTTSLEAMSYHLRRQAPTSLGKLGVSFANLAIEEMCGRIGLSLEELPVAPMDDAPAADALIPAADAVARLRDLSVSKSEQSLLELIGTLTEKRESVNGVIALLKHRVDEVRETIAGAAVDAQYAGVVADGLMPALMPILYTLNDRTENKSYGDTLNPVYGVVSKGSTVVGDLQHFLTEHTHLYKRLIKRQADWVSDHKDNILKTTGGIDQFSFNPVEYQIAGSSPVQDGSAIRYVGPEMPGVVRFETTPGVCETTAGYAGIDAIISASSKLVCGLHTTNGTVQMDPVPVTMLSVDEIRARLAEIERGIEALGHWSDMAYAKLWKDAVFEDMIISHLLKKEAANVNDRGLTLLATSVVALLNSATNDVPQYALRVLSSLLCYVEHSAAHYRSETA